MHIRTVVALCTLTLATTLTHSPSFACSNLPVTCEQQEQFHQENVRRAVEDTERQIAEEQEYKDSLRLTNSPSSGEAGPDPMDARMGDAFGEMKGMAEQAADTLKKNDAKLNDPKFKKYRAGFWEYFQDSRNPKPGEYCVALFASVKGAISISGPGDGYGGAMLTFWGPDIPAPPAVRQVKVTLDQTDTPSQTVTAFNYAAPGGEGGALALAVPTAQAAMDGMVDTHNFKLTLDGQKVFDTTWHNGLAARDKLASCVSKYKG